MRFGLVHRIMTDALAVLGVLAVVSTATLGFVTNIVLVVGLGLALAVPESLQSRPIFRHLATTGMLLLTVVQMARMVAGQPLIDVAVEFAALMQVIRVATRRGAAHDQQIIVLALLHFVAGTVLGGGLTYGLCFFGFLVVAPGALVLSHLRREVEGNYRQGARDRTGLPVDVPRILRSRRVVGRGFLLSTCLISIPIFLFTAVLFVLFPRVGISLFLMNRPPHGRMVGFSDHVDLGQVGVLRSDPSVALRFEPPASTTSPPPTRLTLRLRGTALDTYDGRAWSRSSSERHLAEHNAGGQMYPLVRNPAPGDEKYTFDVEPYDPPVIFLPPNTVAVQVKAPPQSLMSDPLVLQQGAEGEVRYGGGETRGIRYDVYVAPPSTRHLEPMGAADRARYTAPSGLSPRAKALALAWVAGETTDEGKARAIESHLKTEYGYDLGSPSGGKASPVEDFLFVSKRGHCEFFSTAMALLLRDLGIPTRNVTGFVGGTYNRFGNYYAVREGDAHSWVEAFIEDPLTPGMGTWVTFDPTPASGAQPLGDTTGVLVYVRDLLEATSQRWNAYVVNYDMNQQLRLAESASHWYDKKRKSAGLDQGLVGKITRGPIVAGALALLAVAGYVLWQRRRWRKTERKETKKDAPTERTLALAASLYKSLETALMGHGLTRAPSTPPLRFAEMLAERKHPLAGEVLSLTGIYLGARFGQESIDPAAAKAFETRVRAIRTWQPQA
jgi:transglutaminase-like putative cysteine protease